MPQWKFQKTSRDQQGDCLIPNSGHAIYVLRLFRSIDYSVQEKENSNVFIFLSKVLQLYLGKKKYTF